MKLEACDICEVPFGTHQATRAGHFVGTVELQKVQVINVRNKSMGVICQRCAPMASAVLTAFGIPHRYDEYEHKFFVGNDFIDSLPEPTPEERVHFDEFWRIERILP